MVTIGGLVIVLMTQMGEDISKRYVGLATVSVCLSPCLPLCVCVCVRERERVCGERCKQLMPEKVTSVEELETLPAG